jgi:hypothetical protein
MYILEGREPEVDCYEVGLAVSSDEAVVMAVAMAAYVPFFLSQF